MPDFDKLKTLFQIQRHSDSDEEADKAWQELKATLPVPLCQHLEGLDPEKAEFEKTLRGYLAGKIKIVAPTAAEAKQDVSPRPEQKVPGGYPAVLPWPPAEKKVGDFPGYGIDFRGVPHGLNGKGRKRGELPMDRFRRKRKDGSTQFICRYRLTDRSGERKDVYLVHGALARTIAEDLYREQNGR
jgi:hypothetical protein